MAKLTLIRSFVLSIYTLKDNTFASLG